MSKENEIGTLVGSDFMVIGSLIGAGNFGQVFLGKNIHTEQHVAIKFEKIQQEKTSCSKVSLKHEYDMLRKLYKGYPRGCKLNGIPQVFFFGHSGSSDCLVLELLGPNLEDLFDLCGRRFSLKTTLMIGFQLLDRIETVHDRGLIYRDFKPENCLLGLKGTKSFNIIHLVDFGLATYFKDPATNYHLPFRDVCMMTGTARYMSVSSHFGKSLSRRDDLESLAYVLIYFAKGALPWQGLAPGSSVKDRYRMIREIKSKIRVVELCSGLPSQFTAFMSYVKKLNYTDTPDYEFLKALLHSCYEMNGYSYNDPNFDWSKIHTKEDDSKFISISNSDDSSGLCSMTDNLMSASISRKQFATLAPGPEDSEVITCRSGSDLGGSSLNLDEIYDVLGNLNSMSHKEALLGLSASTTKRNLRSIASSDLQVGSMIESRKSKSYGSFSGKTNSRHFCKYKRSSSYSRRKRPPVYMSHPISTGSDCGCPTSKCSSGQNSSLNQNGALFKICWNWFFQCCKLQHRD